MRGKLIMKFKLNAVLASVLSLGVICSGSAFAISSDNENANTPVYTEMSEDNDNLTEEVTEEITEEEPEVANVSTLKKCPGLYGFAFYLHVHYEDRIKQILDELKSGKLEEICAHIRNRREVYYAVPEYEDFINLVSYHDDMFEEKVNYWNDFIRKNNMVKERNLLDELITLVNSAEQEYYSSHSED